METDARTQSTLAVGPSPRSVSDGGGFDVSRRSSLDMPDSSVVIPPVDGHPSAGDGSIGADLSSDSENSTSRFEATGFDPDGPGQILFSQFEAPRFTGSVSFDPSLDRRTQDSLPNSRERGPHVFPGPGETIGEFRLLAALGRGVRGAVFLADQPNLAHRTVVVKLTPRDGGEHLSLARLQHPNIVPLYCVQDVESLDLRLLCMPYLGGIPLSRILAELEGIPIPRRTGRHILDAIDSSRAESPIGNTDQRPARAFLARASYQQAVCWIGACLADALDFAHRRGLVHLDLKPSNILLAADATPMLLDFHLAQPPITPTETGRRWLGGTPHYMAPEHRLAMAEIQEGRPISVAVDGRSDLYALGLVLYQMVGGVTAKGPYPVARIQFRRPASVPVGLGDILARCLADDPSGRYPNPGQLAEDLRRHMTDLPLRGVRNRSLIERGRKWCRRHPGLSLRLVRTAIALAATLVVGGVLVVVDEGRRLRQAETMLAEGRRHIDRGDLASATIEVRQGLSALGSIWLLGNGLHSDRLEALRRDLRTQLSRARRGKLAGELHAAVSQLRLLYGAPIEPGPTLQSLERRLQTTWDSRLDVIRRLEGPGGALSSDRLSDVLDLGILLADLHVRVAKSEDQAAARREALLILNQAEDLFGSSPVLTHERHAYERALGLPVHETSRNGDRVPRTAWESYALGRSLMADGDLEAAGRAFDRAIELRPQDIATQFSRGLCAYRRGLYQEALRAFDVCAALAPETAACYYNRGLTHAALGQLDLSRRDIERARRLAPKEDFFSAPAVK